MTNIADEKPQSTIVIDEKALQVLRNDISPIISRAEEVVITDEKGIETVKAYIIEDRTLRDRALSLIEKPKKNAQELHKWFCSIEKQLTEPVDQARKIYDLKIKGFLDEQDRIREAEQKKEAERIVKEKEKALRSLQGQIERLSGSISDKEGLIRQLEDMRTPDMSLEEIQAIETQISVIRGQINQATAKVETVQMKAEEAAQPVIVETQVPQSTVKGLSAGKKKVGTVVNPKELIKAVSTGAIPIGVVEFNMKSINKLLNEGMEIPGVAWQFDRSIKVRG